MNLSAEQILLLYNELPEEEKGAVLSKLENPDEDGFFQYVELKRQLDELDSCITESDDFVEKIMTFSRSYPSESSVMA